MVLPALLHVVYLTVACCGLCCLVVFSLICVAVLRFAMAWICVVACCCVVLCSDFVLVLCLVAKCLVLM